MAMSSGHLIMKSEWPERLAGGAGPVHCRLLPILDAFSGVLQQGYERPGFAGIGRADAIVCHRPVDAVGQR
jgi:hypothetical protein